MGVLAPLTRRLTRKEKQQVERQGPEASPTMPRKQGQEKRSDLHGTPPTRQLLLSVLAHPYGRSPLRRHRQMPPIAFHDGPPWNFSVPPGRSIRDSALGPWPERFGRLGRGGRPVPMHSEMPCHCRPPAGRAIRLAWKTPRRHAAGPNRVSAGPISHSACWRLERGVKETCLLQESGRVRPEHDGHAAVDPGHWVGRPCGAVVTR